MAALDAAIDHAHLDTGAGRAAHRPFTRDPLGPRLGACECARVASCHGVRRQLLVGWSPRLPLGRSYRFGDRAQRHRRTDRCDTLVSVSCSPFNGGSMQPELTKRLMAEAIGTFGFFFIGFCGIAAVVTQGPGGDPIARYRAWLRVRPGTDDLRVRPHLGRSFQPGRVGGAGRRPTGSRARRSLPYWGAQLAGGFVAALAVRVIFSHSGGADRQCSGSWDLRLQGAGAGDDLHIPVRVGDLHRRDR